MVNTVQRPSLGKGSLASSQSSILAGEIKTEESTTSFLVLVCMGYIPAVLKL